MEFKEFPKIARFSRPIFITEKIDGCNAQITITEDGLILAGSRNRFLTPEKDNHGFAKWVEANKEDLMTLGVGTHYGEFWGSGIQRGYGLPKGEKRFSLFNTARWTDDVRPKCCHVVPLLYQGEFDTAKINATLETLKAFGSVASTGFMRPEGIIIYHTSANMYFKKTIEKDEVPKSLVKEEN